jgi:hypothetical protein
LFDLITKKLFCMKSPTVTHQSHHWRNKWLRKILFGQQVLDRAWEII